MKHIFTFLFIAIFGIASFAQSGINYQAVVRDSGGELIQNTSVDLEFSILSGSTTGPVVYTETHTLTTNNFGNVVAIIGQGTPTTGSFDAIAWQSDDHFLNVTIDGTDMGTTQFMSVPYAQYADMAGSADSLSNPIWRKSGDNIFTNENDKVQIGGASNSDKLTVHSGRAITNGELIDFRLDTASLSDDVLNLYVGPNSSDSAQFIEASKGFTRNFSVNTDGSVNRQQSGLYNDLLPLAYGNINSNGTINTATSNISVTKPSTGRYEITITGENYFYTNYITIATSVITGVIRTSSSAGKLIVFTYDNNNNLADATFQFVTFKP